LKTRGIRAAGSDYGDRRLMAGAKQWLARFDEMIGRLTACGARRARFLEDQVGVVAQLREDHFAAMMKGASSKTGSPASIRNTREPDHADRDGRIDQSPRCHSRMCHSLYIVKSRLPFGKHDSSEACLVYEIYAEFPPVDLLKHPFQQADNQMAWHGRSAACQGEESSWNVLLRGHEDNDDDSLDPRSV
jgi:hypothetical protein